MTHKNRQIHAWCMYDWANSAFMTTAASALMPLYFVSIVPPEGWQFQFLGRTITTNALTLWGIAATVGNLFIFLFAPLLGAIADATTSKKKFMIFFCYLGCSASLALVFFPKLNVTATLLLYLLAGIGLSGSFVFYDAFLPQIAKKEEIDWVSAKGYAYGYVGGGIQFLLSLILVAMHERLGLERLEVLRLAIGMSALWWGGFALVTFWWLEEDSEKGLDRKNAKEPQRSQKILRLCGNFASLRCFVSSGFSRLFTTFKQIRQYKPLFIFLFAFLFYNEGIQTLVKMSVIYGKDELAFSDMTLMGTLLLAQFVGAIGTLLIGRIAGYWGAKRTLMAVLLIWTAVCVFAYAMQIERDYWILGTLVALILGGSQSLSRSIYGAMLPRESPAQFFGFYSVFAKFSAIWGPLILALIRQTTGTARYGILVLGGFFLVGMFLLSQIHRTSKN